MLTCRAMCTVRTVRIDVMVPTMNKKCYEYKKDKKLNLPEDVDVQSITCSPRLAALIAVA
jgi:hypothetical protein